MKFLIPMEWRREISALDFSALEANATDWADLTVTDALVYGQNGVLFTAGALRDMKIPTN